MAARNKFLFLVITLALIFIPACAFSDEESEDVAPKAPEVKVTTVGVIGNPNIASEYILNVVDTKPGSILSREKIQTDIESIYNQGFFSYVDVDIRPDDLGAAVVFSVQENPMIASINFTGNTLYTTEQLMKEVFSQEGTVFNRVFFRNDLDRIQEHYHKDGYVMARVSDVQIQEGNIYVTILEPRIGDIIIQGNRKTKTYVIRRELKLKKGDIFNVTKFRHHLGKLQGLGFFEDVNVGFDVPEDNDSTVDLILTVKEKRTASVGLNLAYGTESGMSGGLTYSDTNLFGRGVNFEVGFNEGDEASYWLTFASNYMDSETYGWRAGVNYRTYDERYYYRQGHRQFEFDERSLAFFAGFGKKFSNEDWSWFLTLRREDTKYSDVKNAIPGYIDDLTPWDGINQTVELSLMWDKRDEYAPHPKGFVLDTNLEQAVKVLGGEYDYLKYWAQARYYASLNGILNGFADTDLSWTDENPLLFAARLRIGSATKDELPAFARYSLGGMNTLRGYNSRSFEGSNMYLGNFELRVPVSSAVSVVGFYDIGNADQKFEWNNYHYDYGIGVRVKTPFGNLRVDYAKGEDENRTYFGFGEMF
ncbi:MAG: POTRA domain-containing protein [Synergistales bacterium]|nr:POTRA domain-containing protein [Synergistales bacterium]MDY6402253.1 POTRA domain-containing protein [Synergistales bacterium]MDY6404968.1 POTRA domain-containing protein [Synergistales bacterium]MDY6410335.1 POTRA domain-containing protein [Synergistales bacterium]MDY6414317.1 POTRA domain-containing protein [Synergistales bacterium]